MGNKCEGEVVCKKLCISGNSKRYLHVHFTEEPNFDNNIRQTIYLIESQNELLILSRNSSLNGSLDGESSKYNCTEGRVCVPRCQAGKLSLSPLSRDMHAEAYSHK